jgi:hypothetical protein
MPYERPVISDPDLNAPNAGVWRIWAVYEALIMLTILVFGSFFGS